MGINAEYMGSPAGVSSLLTSTDMKSIMFIALLLVAAVFCEAEAEAEASPDAYYGYYGHHGLVHDTVTLVTPITDTAISDTMDTGSTPMVRERLMPSPTMAMDTMVMDMDTTAMVMDMVTMVTITMVRGRLMPNPTTGTDTMAIMDIMDTMDTDTTDMDIMDIMDIMDTSMDNELRVENLAEIVIFHIQL